MQQKSASIAQFHTNGICMPGRKRPTIKFGSRLAANTHASSATEAAVSGSGDTTDATAASSAEENAALELSKYLEKITEAKLPIVTDDQKKQDEEIVVGFAVGDTVKVTDGPLMGFLGTVDELDAERETVRVIVSMFGRETPVDLELDQVEPVEQ